MNLSAIDKVTKGKVKTTGISPFSELQIEKVYPNPNQPRKEFKDIEELAASIIEHGLLQPISVVKKDDGYMIVAGERRYRAHLHNEAATIKACIVDMDEHQVKVVALIENIQRDDLNDFEKAKYIGELWASGKYAKKQDLAEAIGKSSSYLSKCFSCLKLDDSIINDLEQNKNDVPLSVLEEIARVKDVDTQNEVYEKYLNGEIIRDDIKDYKSFKDKTFDNGCEFSPGKKENEIYFRYVTPLYNKAIEKKQKGILFDLPFEIKGAYIQRDNDIEFYEFQTGIQIAYGNLLDKTLDEMIYKARGWVLDKGEEKFKALLRVKTVLNDDFSAHYDKVLEKKSIDRDKESKVTEILENQGFIPTQKEKFFTEISQEKNTPGEIGKYTLTGTVGFDGRSLSCENLGAFHLYGSVSDTLFNKEKKYKIIIEEI